MWDTGVLQTVISGGQTGTDLAALYAARYMGLATLGFAPLGYKTEVGNRPDELGRILGLNEDTSSNYGPRTIRNITRSHATLILVRHSYTPGSILTVEKCRVSKKPYLLVQSDNDFFEHMDLVCEWLERVFPVVLNCAGNRASVAGTNFESIVFRFLCHAFSFHLGKPILEPPSFFDYRAKTISTYNLS